MNDLINRQAAIEAIEDSERKTGRWILEIVPSTMGFYQYRCSVCGATSENDTKYCSHCGARMVDDETN